MFDSGISAKELISDIINETDIAIPIQNKQYIYWLNSIEQMLYSEIIKEQYRVKLTIEEEDEDCIIDLSEIVIPNAQTPIFEDVYAFYGDKTQYMKSTETSGAIFPNSYYKCENNLKYNPVKPITEAEIIFIVRPKLKSVNSEDEIQAGNVSIPLEFLDLVKSRLRGEAYKIANEDAVAAKWINDYNVYTETFRSWIENKAPKFGM